MALGTVGSILLGAAIGGGVSAAKGGGTKDILKGAGFGALGGGVGSAISGAAGGAAGGTASGASSGGLASLAGTAGSGGASSLLGATSGGSLASMAGAAGAGGASSLSGPSFGSGLFNGIKSNFLPIYAGSQVLNAVNQAGMAEDMNDAQSKSYQDYLSLINPPEEVKQARYNTLRNQVSTTATDARRRLRDTLASRGIRGRGIGGPNANLERSVMDAQNNAFNQIYGTYNVPGEAPPVNYAPSTANILGKNVSDIGTLLMMQNLYNSAQ